MTIIANNGVEINEGDWVRLEWNAVPSHIAYIEGNAHSDTLNGETRFYVGGFHLGAGRLRTDVKIVEHKPKKLSILEQFGPIVKVNDDVFVWESEAWRLLLRYGGLGLRSHSNEDLLRYAENGEIRRVNPW